MGKQEYHGSTLLLSFVDLPRAFAAFVVSVLVISRFGRRIIPTFGYLLYSEMLYNIILIGEVAIFHPLSVLRLQLIIGWYLGTMQVPILIIGWNKPVKYFASIFLTLRETTPNFELRKKWKTISITPS